MQNDANKKQARIVEKEHTPPWWCLVSISAAPGALKHARSTAVGDERCAASLDVVIARAYNQLHCSRISLPRDVAFVINLLCSFCTYTNNPFPSHPNL